MARQKKATQKEQFMFDQFTGMNLQMALDNLKNDPYDTWKIKVWSVLREICKEASNPDNHEIEFTRGGPWDTIKGVWFRRIPDFSLELGTDFSHDRIAAIMRGMSEKYRFEDEEDYVNGCYYNVSVTTCIDLDCLTIYNISELFNAVMMDR